MPGKKVTKILLSRTLLSEKKIKGMTDAEGWQYIYKNHPPKIQGAKILSREDLNTMVLTGVIK